MDTLPTSFMIVFFTTGLAFKFEVLDLCLIFATFKQVN